MVSFGRAAYDLIGPSYPAVGSGNLWSAWTSDQWLLARRLFGVDSARFCRRDRRYVAVASDGTPGALCCTDRDDQLSDSVVDYGISVVRCSDRVADKTQPLLVSKILN